MDDPKPSIWTRLVAWLLSFLQRRDATAAQDLAATVELQDAAHAAHTAQAAAPDSRARFVDGVRDGSSL